MNTESKPKKGTEWKDEIDGHLNAIKQVMARYNNEKFIGYMTRYMTRELKKVHMDCLRKQLLSSTLELEPFVSQAEEVQQFDRNCLKFACDTKSVRWDDDVPHFLANVSKAEVSYVLGYINREQIEALHDFGIHGAADIIAMIPPFLKASLQEALNIIEEGF